MAAGVILPPHHLLSNYADINVCAPMVRYSKLPFRALVAQYDTHITTTPMILATEFSRHPQARDADFSTNASERGEFEMVPIHGYTSKHPVKIRGSLVCQLAASEPEPLADAAELVSPFVDGIDLNCGWYVHTGSYSPQPWAYAEHIGSYLLRQPETVADMVRAVRSRLGTGYCVSVKIRIDADLSYVSQLTLGARIPLSAMHFMLVLRLSRCMVAHGTSHLPRTLSTWMPSSLPLSVQMLVASRRPGARHQATHGSMEKTGVLAA